MCNDRRSLWRRRLVATIAALALLCAGAIPAMALTTPYLEAYASASDGGAPDTQTTTSGSVSASRSGGYSGFGQTRGADAGASASFGVLKAQSSASASHSAATSGGAARFRDSITITAPGIATGTLGRFGFRVDVSGGLAADNGHANWVLTYQVASFPWTTLAEGDVYDDPGGAGVSGDPFGGVYDSSLWLFRFGEPFTLEMLLGTLTTAGGSTIAGSATALFGNSVEWQGLVAVQDYGTHAPIAGWVASSASGTDYARPIPEASTALLLAAGLLGLARHSRRVV